jgi:general secretion pathway protein I
MQVLRKQNGLTLLEVLVALVILAVALTAIIKATVENIRATAYLKEKTVATWVGLNALNKARLALIQLPDAPEHREATESMLNQNWEWQGYKKATNNAHIPELHIKVFHLPEHRFVTELTSYAYVS